MTVSPGASIDVVDVSKGLGGVLVLSNVNLTLGPGAVYGVVGPNGSGKSTLLRILAGQLTPDTGTITVCNQRLGQRGWFTSAADARRYVSYLPDQNEALLELTGYEFLNLHYALRGVTPSRSGSSRDETEHEEALGLREFAGRRLSVLSQGQRKRVHIAGSLGGTPPVWLLDEPTNALDAQTCAYLARVVDERRAAGLITVAVTHDQNALRHWDAEVVPIERLQRRD